MGKEWGISLSFFLLSPLYHFHPLHIHLDFSKNVTVESSTQHIASSGSRKMGAFGFSTQLAILGKPGNVCHSRKKINSEKDLVE